MTEPQREVARRSRDGGIADTNYGLVSSRLSASRRFCRVQSLYGSPPRRSFCSYKRNQDSLAAKLRCLRRILFSFCKLIAESTAVETMGWISSYLPRRPLPRHGGGKQGGGRCGRRLPLERICAQYGFGFFAPEKSKSVSSTAKRQRGLSRGKLGPP